MQIAKYDIFTETFDVNIVPVEDLGSWTPKSGHSKNQAGKDLGLWSRWVKVQCSNNKKAHICDLVQPHTKYATLGKSLFSQPRVPYLWEERDQLRWSLRSIPAPTV